VDDAVSISDASRLREFVHGAPQPSHGSRAGPDLAADLGADQAFDEGAELGSGLDSSEHGDLGAGEEWCRVDEVFVILSPLAPPPSPPRKARLDRGRQREERREGIARPPDELASVGRRGIDRLDGIVEFSGCQEGSVALGLRPRVGCESFRRGGAPRSKEQSEPGGIAAEPVAGEPIAGSDVPGQPPSIGRAALWRGGLEEAQFETVMKPS
jgi:hypothetical protein